MYFIGNSCIKRYKLCVCMFWRIERKLKDLELIKVISSRKNVYLHGTPLLIRSHHLPLT